MGDLLEIWEEHKVGFEELVKRVGGEEEEEEVSRGTCDNGNYPWDSLGLSGGDL